MNDKRNFKNGNGDESLGAPITDELDGLLRDWHIENADAAKAGRDRLLAALRISSPDESPDPVAPAATMASDVQINARPASTDSVRQHHHSWRAVAARFTPAAAAIILIAILIAFNPSRQRRSYADIIYAPSGGALTAVDALGRTRGPCPLKDTYVDVDISGRFARVTLWQTFHNPYNDKIEAVYTFPMSHNGAVDRMTMSIGERIIIGEVHERQRAKEIYETAKQQGHVAALLEQERPNIFTQSVANIEPGAEILVEISYIETLTPRNGLCEFAFPMVVAPRFIPASDDKPLGDAARFAAHRNGVSLLAPAEIEVIESNEDDADGFLRRILDAAVPIEITDDTAWRSDANGNPTKAIATFKADYDALADEPGTVYSNGTGQINGRWFAFDRNAIRHGTNAVPDAGRITPPVATPDTRAGHDIAISISLETGGPGITEIETPLHDTTITSDAYNSAGLVTHTNIDLSNQADIPNRDFVLRWRTESDEITDAVLAHTGDLGNFVTIMLDPPARFEADDLVPREIVFVIDTSGSMKGEPLNKAKQVMAQALEAMGPNDTFNVIAFSDSATPLWNAPREASLDNIDEAHIFVATHESNGGTQMMQAVRMALASDGASEAAATDDLAYDFNTIDIAQLATLRADGRHIVVRLDPKNIIYLRPESEDDAITAAVMLDDDVSIYIRNLGIPVDALRPDEPVLLTGWLRTDADGLPYIEADEFGPARRPADLLRPARLPQLPADDRRVRLLVRCEEIDGFTDRATGEWIEGVSTDNDEFVLFEGFQIHQHDDASAMILTGRWTGGDDPRFVVESAIHVPREWTDPSPMRVVCFLTDGQVGNDMAIIDEIRRTADRTRFYSLGIGNSVNRYLLDGMAEAGRGVGDVILLEDDAHAAIQRFAQRMKAPVLLNPSIEFSDGLDIIDMQPEELPDLFDERPIVIHARYETPGEGTITIRGDAADGPFARTINVELPDYEPRHESLPSLWARAKVDAIMNRNLKAAQQGNFNANWRIEIIDLGETFQIMTQYTSFVAVERLNVTYGGQPVRIEVPVELPDGMAPEGAIARQLMINAENYETWPQRVDRKVAKLRELQEFAAVMDALVRHDPTIAEASNVDDAANVADTSDAREGRVDAADSQSNEENTAALEALKVRAPLIRVDALPLDVVLEMWARESKLEIAPDWSALSALSIDKNTAVSLQLTDVSFGRALDLILDEAGAGEIDLGYVIQDGVIRILPKVELERLKAVRQAETQRLLAAIRPFSDQDRTPTTPEEVNDANAATNIRELEKEIRIDVIDGNYEDAFRKLDVARQNLEANRRYASLASEYDDFRGHLQDLERLIEDEQRAYGENAIRYQTEDISRIHQDKITRIQETKARRVDELVSRASELRKEGRLDESIQVLDQVLQIQPDHEQAQWMHDTLGVLSQSIRDRESVLTRQRDTRDVLIENDLSGVPYHENMTYPKNWPEIAARRRSPEGLGTVVVDSNINGSISPIKADDIDAGVPILAQIPVLKEHFAPKADNPMIADRSQLDIKTAVPTLSKKGTDIFRVEETNGRHRMVLSDEGRRIIAQCQRDWALGQQGGNLDNHPGTTARGHILPAADGSLIIESLEDPIERQLYDQFLPERIEIRASHPNDQFGRTKTGVLFTVISSLEEPAVSHGAENDDARSAIHDPASTTDSYREFCYDSAGQRSRGVAPASRQPMQDTLASLDVSTVARAKNGAPRQFVSPSVSEELTSLGATVTYDPSPPATNDAYGRPLTMTATQTFYLDVASQDAHEILSTVGLDAAIGSLRIAASVDEQDGDQLWDYSLNYENPEWIHQVLVQLTKESESTTNSGSQDEESTSATDSQSAGGHHRITSNQGIDNRRGDQTRVVYSVDLTPTQSLGELAEEIDHEESSGESTSPGAQAEELHRLDDLAVRNVMKSVHDTPAAPQPSASAPYSIPEIKFDKEPLESAVQQLADAANIDITIDIDTLHAAGYACDSRVTITTDAGNVTDVLSQVLNAVSADAEPLDFVETNQGLFITTQSAARRMLRLVTTVHNVADFFAYEDLPTTITTHDDTDMPPTWRLSRFIADIVDQTALVHAGQSRTSVRFAGDNIIITHTPDFHRRIANWLAALRSARFESPTSAADVYRIAAGLRAGTNTADDVLNLLNAHPDDTLARLLLESTLAQHVNIVGPPPPLETVMASAMHELRAAAARTKRISTCIDEPLLALMAGADMPTQNALPKEITEVAHATPRRKSSSDQGAASPLQCGRHGVAVSVLLADATSTTLDAVRQSGLKIESVAASANVAVGNIALSRLADLATLSNVRRIEAAQFRVPASAPQRPRFRAAASPRRSQAQATLR